MKVDTQSDTWRDIEKWANSEIAKLRELNDSDMDTTETANIRGGIKKLKDLLALAKKPAQIEKVGSTNYID